MIEKQTRDGQGHVQQNSVKKIREKVQSEEKEDYAASFLLCMITLLLNNNRLFFKVV